jgi:hypothetical protein
MYFSKQAKTGMDTLTLMICFNKLIRQSIFSNRKQTDLLLPFFYLIMLPAIRDEHPMLAQHAKCPKVPIQLGGTTKMVLKCGQRLLGLITHLKTYTSQTIIQRCPDGSKGWRLLSVNRDFGHRKD